MTAAFEIGSQYFTADGREVELQAITNDGRYVVTALVEYESEWGSEIGEGHTFIADKLYPDPPREKIDADLKAARDELAVVEAQLRERKAQATREITEAEKEVEKRLARLRRYAALERVEDFVEGRLTHAVVKNYSDYKVCPVEELEEKWNGRAEGIRLITLFGDSKGDLQWRVNQYKDHSGSTYDMWPCCGEEEAIAKRAEWIACDIASDNDYTRRVAVKAALKHGIPVPAEPLADFRKTEADSRAKRAASLKADIAKKQSELSEIEAVEAAE